MSAIGSLVFCTDCGNLLESSTGNKETILLCGCCGAENRDTASQTITTTSKPESFPSKLRQQLSSIQTVRLSDLQTDATIAVSCPKCDVKEVRWAQAQLRGADEGSTIFYTCPGCNYKWNTNN
ncbi:hypothetical protein B0O99DRAFT_651741 [Bisporella sp. PMI_857]|nr:hypothetical protein B0O99DRAFT_651741 [Bisporella sp. PMI_857]